MAQNNERLSQQHEVHDREALADLGEKQHEVIRENLEKSQEKSPEKLEDVRREAVEKAQAIENDTKKHEKQKPAKAERRTGPSKKEHAASYKKIMNQVQSELSTPSKVFSKFIHTQPIEKTSAFVGATVARPNAILAGSMLAFVFTLVVFLIARYYGYPLSGTETIAAFVLGWAIGILYDYLRVMITGKTQ